MARRLTGADETTWEARTGDAADVAVPRLFGDGGHPTTQLAAEAVERAIRACASPRVLDAGTGTGVLAERARACGASEIVAVDRDAAAVLNARARVPEARVARRDLERPLHDLGRFDVIVANLPYPEVRRCIPHLAGVAAFGARVIVTGAPLVFAGRCERTLTACGLRVAERRALSGWCALIAFRRGTDIQPCAR